MGKDCGKRNCDVNFSKLITDNSTLRLNSLIESLKSGTYKEGDYAEISFGEGGCKKVSLFASKGGNDEYLIFLIDVTEHKNLEERFVHSQKMQAMGQLAGGVAHDFNNLLTAMIGFCDLLLQRHSPSDQSFADIMQIKQNAHRAANLVRQLLAFSRKQTLQPEVIDITDALAELSNLIRRLIGENIELKVNHGRDIGNIRVDQGQLEQVLVNLAVNARDAMLEGGKLTIKTSNVIVNNEYKLSQEFITSSDVREMVKGEYVLIEVSDSGHGMNFEVMQNIFEPFFTTKDIGEGTGLGLSTVYGIIQQTGGYIYVSSEEGKGTKFSIFLKKHEGDVENASKDSDVVKSLGQDLTGEGVVLLVEDEDPVRMFASRALSNKGYKVLEADCGEKALSIVEEQKGNIDIIITDVMMPGITGTAMIKEISVKYPDINVVFISGYGEDAFVKTYGSERKFNFLSKPFTLNQLAEKVKNVMSEK